jgi:hypothetical protein
MIQTVTESNCDRIIEVAAIVFRRLNEISLTAYGINKSMVLELEKRTAKQFLANQLIGANLALRKCDGEARMFFVEHREDGDTQIWLHPSPAGERWLNVEHNEHHPITTAGASEYFDLGAMLNRDAKADWKTASRYGDDLAKAIAEGDIYANPV